MTQCLAVCLLMSSCDAPETQQIDSTVVDTVPALQLARIGASGRTTPEYLFGQVVAVAGAPDGAFYVADRIGSEVRSYSNEGRYLGTVGSEGDGPGEFRHLRDLYMDARGALHVRGAYDITVFEASSGSAYADSLVRTLPVPSIRSPSFVRMTTDGERYFGPSYDYADFQIRGYHYVVFDTVGAIRDTIFVPPFPSPELTGSANYPVNDRGFGQNVEGVNRAPFEAAPSWDISRDGRVLLSMGARYDVVEVSSEGDTVRVISRSSGPQPVPSAEAGDSARAFRERLDSIPVPLSEMRGMSDMARRGDLPSTLPAILSVHYVEPGRVWVRRWPHSVEETLFDVFDQEGRLMEVVRLPVSLRRSPPPWIAADVVVAVLQDPTTGVDEVAVFQLRRD